MPTPRSSIRPASVCTGRTRIRPLTLSRWTRSSPTSRAKRRQPLCAAATSSRARRDLPAPDGPRIRTARAPTSTAEAWMVADVIRRSPHWIAAATAMSGQASASHRRQAHDKARAEHLRLAVRAGRAGSVLDPDRSAMGIDDLFGDRQTQPGILAKSLVRAVGVKALENLFQGIGTHAGSVVVDENLYLIAQPPTGDTHRGAGRRERTRVLDQIIDDLSEPGIVSRHLERARAAAFEFQGDFDAVVTLDLVRYANERAEELGEIDRRSLLALQLGVEPAGVGNIRDQPIEPAHVMLDDVEEPAPAFFGLGDRQRFHRRAQRGERIFQFMGDVGGKAFDRFDP